MPAEAPLPLDAVGLTDVGRERDHNEDVVLCLPGRLRFAAIDGMGGHAAGEVAAAIAAEALATDLPLVDAVVEANRRIQAESDDERRGMGCVLTAAQLEGGKAFLAHVGDTRAYLANEAGARRVTQDHTTAGIREALEGLSDDEARALPHRNEVLRDVGHMVLDTPELVETYEVEVVDGDLLMLCSDGLTDMMPDSQLLPWLAAARTDVRGSKELAAELIRRANEAGGHDNITVVLVRLRPAPVEPETVPGERPAKEGGPPLRWWPWFLTAGALAGLGAWWLLPDDPSVERVQSVEVAAPSSPIPPEPVGRVAEPLTLPAQVTLKAGETRELKNQRLRWPSPAAEVRIVLARGARLAWSDITLEAPAGALVVRGEPESRLELTRSALPFERVTITTEGEVSFQEVDWGSAVVVVRRGRVAAARRGAVSEASPGEDQALPLRAAAPFTVSPGTSAAPTVTPVPDREGPR